MYPPIVTPQANSDDVSNLNFDERLLKSYEPTLMYLEANSVTVNLASLQRIALVRLQRELLQEVFEFMYGDADNDSDLDIDSTIHRYSRFYPEHEVDFLLTSTAEALKEWEYIKKSATKGKFNDPFIMTSQKGHDRAVLTETIQKWEADLSRMEV